VGTITICICAAIGLLLLALFLDGLLKANELLDEEGAERRPKWIRHHQQTDRIEVMMKHLSKEKE
jgi:hypothetical protein